MTNEARLLFKSGHYKASALLLEHILQYTSDNHTTNYISAMAFQLSGDIEKSKFYYKKAYELNSDYTDYYADDLTTNPLSFKKSVSIELSNLCNYSKIHTKCPLYDEKEPQVMPTYLIKKIIEELKDHNYKGTIMFSVYNEPLIDPRLFYLLDYSIKQLKDIKLHVLTNGFFLTQEVMDDLTDIGVK